MATPKPQLPALAARAPDTNKGDYGSVFVIAGSVGMTGAAALAAEAAARAGAGLVFLLCPDATWGVLAAQLREVLVRPVGPEGAWDWTPAAAEDVKAFIGKTGGRRIAVAMGPGMGREPGAAECARTLALGLEHPLVLDADGLNAFEGRADELTSRSAPTILTPHPGEAYRLAGKFDGRDNGERSDAALGLARATGAVVVLKGRRTVITDGERTETNETGNPGMATGGSGDVLTGVIAGLVAAGAADMDAFGAARLGAHVHGLAGDLAAGEVGQTSLIAGDVLRHLPAAFMSL
ncbi:MAG: NAD(P)H-hydrate dehydratase [Planctomycetota bacterium]